MLKKLMGSGLVWLWIAVVVMWLDVASKTWVTNHLGLLEPMPIFSLFNLTLAHNTGAAFSVLQSMSGWQNILLGGLAAIVSLLILWWLAKSPRQAIWTNIALTLVLGGALGNALDRVRYGYVIDFLDFHWQAWHFAIFNLADSAISIGAFMLICHWLKSSAK